MKRRKDVNQEGHLRDFKLCICLNGVGVSSEITQGSHLREKTAFFTQKKQATQV